MDGETDHVPLRQSIPLDPKKIMKKTIAMGFGIWFGVGFVSFTFVSALLSQSFGFLPLLAAVAVASLALSLVVSFVYQRAYFASYFYDVNDDFLVIKKGVFMPKETTLPFDRITDVYVDRDILDVLFGLYDVHVSTPTVQSGLSAHIDGVTLENSEKLKSILLRLVKGGARGA